MLMSATRRLQWPSERGLLPDNGLMGMLWSAYYAGTDTDRWRSNCPPRVRHASVGYLSEQCLFSISFSPIPNANVNFSVSASFDLGIFPSWALHPSSFPNVRLAAAAYEHDLGDAAPKAGLAGSPALT